jgi:hypothetical protein
VVRVAVSPDWPGGDALQNTVAEHFIESQLGHVNVADVATARPVGTGSLRQHPFEIGIVQIAQRRADEVTTADGAVAIHADYGVPGSARPTEAGMTAVVYGKERVDLSKPLLLLAAIVVRSVLVGVDSEIDVRR